jgi:hypothetical protein
VRVLNRTVKQISEEYYSIHCELGATGTAPATTHEVAYVAVTPYGGFYGDAAVWASDDGVSYTLIVNDLAHGSVDTGIWAVSPGDMNHRYWMLKYAVVFGGGFYSGADFKAVRLLDTAGNDALNTQGFNPGHGPAIPWGLVQPLVLTGPSIPYTVSIVSGTAGAYGQYLTASFSGFASGSRQGDFTYISPDSSFGIGSAVIGAGLIDIRWVWDLGA